MLRGKLLLFGAGFLGIVTALLPLPRQDNPPVLPVDTATAGLPELLAVPGIGLKRAGRLTEEHLLRAMNAGRGQTVPGESQP